MFQTWTAFDTDDLIQWARDFSPTELSRFFDHNDNEPLLSRKHVSETFMQWEAKRHPDLISAAARPRLVEVCPGQWCIAIASLHAGSQKRRPLLLREDFNLFMLARLTFLLASDSATRLQADVSSKTSMQEVLDHLNARLDSLGISEEIAAASKAMSTKASAYYSLGALAAGEQGRQAAFEDLSERFSDAHNR